MDTFTRPTMFWVFLILSLAPASAGAQSSAASVSARFYYEDFASPADAGVRVEVDGAEVGQTDATGDLTFSVSPGMHEIRGIEPGVIAGVAEIDVSAGEVLMLDVLMKGTTALLGRADLVIDEAPFGVLPENFSSLTLRLVDDQGATIEISHLYGVFFEEGDGSNRQTIGSLFSLQPGGAVSATQLAAVEAVVDGLDGSYLIHLSGEDASGEIFDEAIRLPEPALFDGMGAALLLIASVCRSRAIAKVGLSAGTRG